MFQLDHIRRGVKVAGLKAKLCSVPVSVAVMAHWQNGPARLSLLKTRDFC
jgi:hypothetical protein